MMFETVPAEIRQFGSPSDFIHCTVLLIQAKGKWDAGKRKLTVCVKNS